MSASELVIVTERAVEEIRSIFEREKPGSGMGLRLGVVGGGCSGLSYEMEFSETRTNDKILDFDGFRGSARSQVRHLPQGCHPRFRGRPQGQGLCLQKPERHQHLRLR